MRMLFLLVILSTITLLPHVAASPSAMIQNDSSYVDSLGYHHVVGEVLNTGDAWLMSAKVTGTLKNSSGGIVDVNITYTYAEYMPPEARSPFDLIEANATKSATVASYSLTLQFAISTAPPRVSLTVEGLTSSTDSSGNLNLLGQVRNTGIEESNFTKVYATFYDKSGKVIYVDFAYTSPSTIPAGQTSNFKILGPNSTIASHVTAFTAGAESNQYTSVDELPAPMTLLILLVAVVSTTLLCRQRRKS